MPLDSDAILDRRALRRKLTFWRVAAVLVAVAGIAAAGFIGARRAGFLPLAPHVARIEIRGVIGQNADLIRLIEAIGRNANVRGLMVTIDSPGGTVSGSEALFNAIRAVAAAKPTVAVVEGTAASGGYISAIAADHIVSRETSLTGSIGVVAQFPNVTRLLETWGVRVDAVRSTPLKAMPSGIEPTSPEAVEALREVVLDGYAWFRRLVRERRNMSEEELGAVADGRVFTGRRARDLKLVDTIGGERDARAWLATRGVPDNLGVRLYRPPRSANLSALNWVGAALAEAAGLAELAERVRTSGAAARIELSALDGLLAVWQPPSP